jgi:hypothetical protein
MPPHDIDVREECVVDYYAVGAKAPKAYRPSAAASNVHLSSRSS